MAGEQGALGPTGEVGNRPPMPCKLIETPKGGQRAALQWLPTTWRHSGCSSRNNSTLHQDSSAQPGTSAAPQLQQLGKQSASLTPMARFCRLTTCSSLPLCSITLPTRSCSGRLDQSDQRQTHSSRNSIHRHGHQAAPPPPAAATRRRSAPHLIGLLLEAAQLLQCLGQAG